MLRHTILLIAVFYASITSAKNSYQIDMILFAHPEASSETLRTNTPLIPIDAAIRQLKISTIKTDSLYTLLPPSQSGLHDEYYLLNRKSPFKVLAQYSWRQNDLKNGIVALPKLNSKGWLIQGTVNTARGSYYSFNTKLQCSPPSNPEGAITIAQKQRIEEGKLYYLDNPYVGMVVKIHRIE